MFLFNKHTWHMSLRRKFKSERAPLVDSEAVRRCKEKFGSTRRGQPNKCQRTSQRNVCQVGVRDILSYKMFLPLLLHLKLRIRDATVPLFFSNRNNTNTWIRALANTKYQC